MTAEQPHQILKDKTLRVASGGNNVLPEKVFVARNSYLRAIYENELVIKGWYYIFGAQVIAILPCVFVEYFTANEGEVTAISILKNGLKGIHLAALLWCVLFVATLLVFWVFQLWAKIRVRILNRKVLLKYWDHFWIACIPCYYLGGLYLSAYAIELINLPFMLSFITMVETIRLLMKAHSFIRRSASEIAAYKPHSDMVDPKKEFSKFLYFLFCPTLLYRDEYPRTAAVRWTFVINCITHLVISAVVLSYLFKMFVLQPLTQFGVVPYTWKDLLLIFFRLNMIGPLFTLLLFSFLLEFWENLFAELTMFADRLFYKDWWNSTDYLKFYKTWNVVVHDWLYEYVYREMYIYVTPGNKLIARTTVILMSAVFHEVIIYVGLRTFQPFLFIIFFFAGSILTFVCTTDHYIWHILFVYGQCFGNMLLLFLYTLGYKATCCNSNLSELVVTE